jgi:hypothetical protein
LKKFEKALLRKVISLFLLFAAVFLGFTIMGSWLSWFSRNTVMCLFIVSFSLLFIGSFLIVIVLIFYERFFLRNLTINPNPPSMAKNTPTISTARIILSLF